MHVDATRGDKESQNHVEFRAPTAYELSKAPGGEVGQGCTLDGRLSVGKVSANFRIVASMKHPAAVLQATNPLLALQDRIQSMDHLRHANVSHVVHSMHFGERFPGMAAPLDGVVQHLAAGQQHYMLKIIPTIHDRFPRKPISTNQYALSEQFISHELVMLTPRPDRERHRRGPETVHGSARCIARLVPTHSYLMIRFAPNGAAMDPGVYFFYDFFPVMIQIVQNRCAPMMPRRLAGAAAGAIKSPLRVP
ncbi:endoplasmic reticulum vesicle transporter-domain-containing protein [Pelagophyceae sp. CCMP2097]|nr:endoplasmic reticulum vesicle transporter-domain-containing protein [Pelagophyceae sp. CCMP2097]